MATARKGIYDPNHKSVGASNEFDEAAPEAGHTEATWRAHAAKRTNHGEGATKPRKPSRASSSSNARVSARGNRAQPKRAADSAADDNRE